MVLVQARRLSNLSVGQFVSNWSVRWVNCGEMADWIWMPFKMVSGVGRGIGCIRWGPHPQGFFRLIGLSNVLSVFLKQKCI